MCFSILFWRAEQQWGPSTASAAPLTSSKQPQAEHSCEGHARTEQIKFKPFSLQSFLLLLLHLPTPCNRCNFSYTLFRFESWSFCFSPPLIPAGSSSLSRPKRCQERGNAPGKLLLLQFSKFCWQLDVFDIKNIVWRGLGRKGVRRGKLGRDGLGVKAWKRLEDCPGAPKHLAEG